MRPGELKAWAWWFSEDARPAWHAEAACRGRGELFFAEGKSREAQAARQKAVELCDGCPVRAQCFRYADHAEVRHGVWAGRTATFWLLRARLRAAGGTP